MSNVNTEGLTVISGTVLEHSSGTNEVRNQGNAVDIYLFILIEKDNGEVVRINNAVVDANVFQQIRVGQSTTVYIFKDSRGLGRSTKNFIVAGKTDKGVGLLDTRGINFAVVKIAFTGLIVGAFLSLISALWLVGFLGSFGGFLSFLIFAAIFGYSLLHAYNMAKMGNISKRLRRQLTGTGDQYKGAVIQNI